MSGDEEKSDRISKHLKEVYDEDVNETLPEKLAQLVKKLRGEPEDKS